MRRERPDPWYDPPRRHRIRGRDKAEFIIAALLLVGLLGLLAIGVARDTPRAPGSTPSLSPP
ncbi:hypothetical protein ACIBSW_03550 [Actinoplanes sp. NPDC049668]|uniref:hypothetical protein n=1 Tax=unclassified Actinoplanes TaxID=2626549 RepID=UPI0033B5BCE7